MKLITVLVQDQDAATAVSLLAEIALDLKMSTPGQELGQGTPVPGPTRAGPSRVNRVPGKTAAEVIVEALTAKALSLAALQERMHRLGYAPNTLSARLSEMDRAGLVVRYDDRGRVMYKLPLSVQAAAEGL